MGLADQRSALAACGLTPGVISTIEDARAPSTRSLYRTKWQVFEKWCAKQVPSVVPARATIGEVLNFLQSKRDENLTHSTIKVYVSALSAHHPGFHGKAVGKHRLVAPFLKGVLRQTAVDRPLFPAWDLPVVLQGLCEHPFEPMATSSDRALSLKTVLLVALATSKRVSDIQALSVDEDCMQFSTDGKSVRLKPNLRFVTKNLRVPEAPVHLTSFHPPPFATAQDEKLHCLCPVRALRLYTDRTKESRTTTQLFVSYKPGARHAAVGRASLSRWIVEAIKEAYVSAGAPVPVALRAHSTRGVSTSWAVSRGASVQEICDAANWATPLTFVTYYCLDVPASTAAHAVLSVAEGHIQ